jgi:hypothetical protein
MGRSTNGGPAICRIEKPVGYLKIMFAEVYFVRRRVIPWQSQEREVDRRA